jgi:hypothetical protein
MTDITELAQSLKAAADREMICRDGAETSEIWERTVTPENILALVEALESEKRICATWRKTATAVSEKLEKAQQCITELKSGKVGNALLERENHHVEVVGKLTERIAELESRTVTVKLPQRYDLIGETDGNCSLNDAEMAPDNDGVYLRVRDVREMLTAAGIKVEAE